MSKVDTDHLITLLDSLAIELVFQHSSHFELNMEALYDSIGSNYAKLRKPDQRIAAAIEHKLNDAKTILNIGAGTGSYEPTNREVTALEPSSVMIAQRSIRAASVIQANAENLPFSDKSFDISLAILSIHHWKDQIKGLCEMKRVSRRQLLFTWNPLHPGFWLTQIYFPEILAIDKSIFPKFSLIERILGPLVIEHGPIPADCTDGFGSAYWNRPEAYLSHEVRSAMSSFNKITQLKEGIAKLKQDIECGEWDRKYGHLRQRNELDVGFAILTSTN